MIIWSGWGMLSALIAAAGLVGSVLLDPALARVGIPTPSGVVLVWIVAAAFNWWLGTRLNNRPGRELVDPRTGQTVVLRRRHTLFWIPMQYYSVLMVLLGALSVLGAMHGGSPGRKAGPAARASLTAAAAWRLAALPDAKPPASPRGRRAAGWTSVSGRG
ncbi:hypothetical protein SAMN02799631_02164 [Methylobacterium sp. 174MFSha1.1]|uniref:hypothetical protein n=1 Tax=Methylobacterium sp. 174MFSha1.1 TaxID=1502749 RepID=UPI0008E61458|nr:hypothetical protein [Methylobacterium sp. 174MFSha1.1]SFU76115.1 hypothetical protein SAMN02799631_02164 [Methylobacterium sp. 174MFSha1.1]